MKDVALFALGVFIVLGLVVYMVYAAMSRDVDRHNAGCTAAGGTMMVVHANVTMGNTWACITPDGKEVPYKF